MQLGGSICSRHKDTLDVLPTLLLDFYSFFNFSPLIFIFSFFPAFGSMNCLCSMTGGLQCVTIPELKLLGEESSAHPFWRPWALHTNTEASSVHARSASQLEELQA